MSCSFFLCFPYTYILVSYITYIQIQYYSYRIWFFHLLKYKNQSNSIFTALIVPVVVDYYSIFSFRTVGEGDVPVLWYIANLPIQASSCKFTVIWYPYCSHIRCCAVLCMWNFTKLDDYLWHFTCPVFTFTMLGYWNVNLNVLSILKSTLFDTVEQNLDFAAIYKVVTIIKCTIS